MTAFEEVIPTGQVIAIVSGKGGTGKTSFTANVGMALAQMGHPTLCFDCDIGLRNLDIALSMTDRAVMDFTDVLSNCCTLDEAVAPHPKQKNLYLLTAPTRLHGTEIDMEKLRALFDEIREKFDYCLVDAPAGLETGFRLALTGADRAVVVTNTDLPSLRYCAASFLTSVVFPPEPTTAMIINSVLPFAAGWLPERRRQYTGLCRKS